MNNNDTNILLRHNFVPSTLAIHSDVPNAEALSTVMMNLSYYGYALNIDAFNNLRAMTCNHLTTWWNQVEPELKAITGDDLNMGDFVVYKNFPGEGFNKTESEYWFAQILIYWGLPCELFAEKVEARAKMDEQPKLKVLRQATNSTLFSILQSYLASPTRWKPQDLKDVLHLIQTNQVDFSRCKFKENLIELAKVFIQDGQSIDLNATDSLRLAAALSDGDVALKEKFKFRSFDRKTRKFFLSALEKTSNLTEDVGRRPELWKRFLHNLHPYDYTKAFPKVCEVNDNLYLDKIKTFNSDVELAFLAQDPNVLNLLTFRPGEFKRRLVHCLLTFGMPAAEAFASDKVLSKLTNYQLVSLRSFLETINGRKTRVFPPKGNWNKLQIGTARKVHKKYTTFINAKIGQTLAKRLAKIQVLDPATSQIKLSSNDGDVASYTRGTVFDIPEDVKFIRSASYWENPGATTWFDNGWNFFDKNWKAVGTCCWSTPKDVTGVGFSGDPVNCTNKQGKATQLIDLNLADIPKNIRYAVWNVLAYSRVTFGKATKVFAALQWGTDANKGELFEPSRCQLSFPLTGEQLTKYVCYLDLKDRKMVFMDANLKGAVNSAATNAGTLEKQMPAFVEYLSSLPSVHDLFRDSVDKDKGTGYVLYSDKGVELKETKAYVFSPENKLNNYDRIDVNLIASKV